MFGLVVDRETHLPVFTGVHQDRPSLNPVFQVLGCPAGTDNRFNLGIDPGRDPIPVTRLRQLMSKIYVAICSVEHTDCELLLSILIFGKKC